MNAGVVADRTVQGSPGTTVGPSWLTWGAPLFAALLSFAASLPGLAMPFLSDDWHLLELTGAERPPLAVYGYLRPIHLASLWIDRGLWGVSPAPFHLTNLVLIAASASLVVLVAQRLTHDVRLAAVAGALFALHPYHVENAAWVANRADQLFTVFFLLGLLAYERWRAGAGGLPVAAWLFFAAGLMSKESAVMLPAAVIALGLLVRARRPSSREISLGWMPLVLLAGVHFVLVRPALVPGEERMLVPRIGLGWARQILGLIVGCLVPVDGEILAHRPHVFGALAAVLFAGLFAVAWVRAGRPPRLALAAGIVFVLLLLPAGVGFEERYVFLPSVAFAVMMAALLRAAGGWLGRALGVALLAGWLAALAVHWGQWLEAGRSSERILSQLGEASRDPSVGEIVVANLPYRVHEGAVAGDFRAALALTGGRAMPVRGMSWFAYPSERTETLAGDSGRAIVHEEGFTDVHLALGEGPFFEITSPRPSASGTEVLRPAGSLLFEGNGTLRVRILKDAPAGRIAFVWSEGEMVRLF